MVRGLGGLGFKGLGVSLVNGFRFYEVDIGIKGLGVRG